MKKAIGMLALMLAAALAGCSTGRNNDWYSRSNRSMDSAEINDSMDNSITDSGGGSDSTSLIKLP